MADALSGWQKVALSEIAEIYDGPHATPEKIESGPIYLNISNLVDGRVVLDHTYHLSEEDYIHWTRRITPRPRDIVFSYETRIGQAAIIPEGLRCCLGRRMGLLRVNQEKAFPEYLVYAYLGPEFQNVIRENKVTGGTVERIPLTKMPRYELHLPPLAEQRKIAAILGTWDAAIATVEQLIVALQARKQGLMQRLLTGEVRQNWDVATLDEVTDVVLSGVDKKSEDDEIPVRLCNYMDVFYNRYIVDSMPFMEATATQQEIEKCTLRVNDVIITKDSETVPEIAQAAVVAEELSGVLCGYHMAILRPDAERIHGPFLSELLMIPDIHQQFEQSANGVTRFGLTRSAIGNIKVAFPPLESQKDIAQVAQICEQMGANYRKYASALKKQKQALMQQLLTGKVRVRTEGESASHELHTDGRGLHYTNKVHT